LRHRLLDGNGARLFATAVRAAIKNEVVPTPLSRASWLAALQPSNRSSLCCHFLWLLVADLSFSIPSNGFQIRGWTGAGGDRDGVWKLLRYAIAGGQSLLVAAKGGNFEQFREYRGRQSLPLFCTLDIFRSPPTIARLGIVWAVGTG